jgi:hypothetical protein
MLGEEDYGEDMQEANTDVDPAPWAFKYQLRGGVNGVLPLIDIEKKRVLRAVRRDRPNETFAVFDSGETRIVLNLDHLTFCHFLFHPDKLVRPDRHPPEEIQVSMADSNEPLFFEVADVWNTDDAEEAAQFAQIIATAKSLLRGEDEVFHFTDGGGEQAFLRANDVAMIRIPRWVVEPPPWFKVDADPD